MEHPAHRHRTGASFKAFYFGQKNLKEWLTGAVFFYHSFRRFERKNKAGPLLTLLIPPCLHFITKDRNAGGHLLECRMQDVTVQIDHINNFFMALPHGGEFYSTDLAQDKKKDIETVEKGTSRTGVEN